LETLIEDDAVIPKNMTLPLSSLLGFPGLPTFLATDEPTYYNDDVLGACKRNGTDYVTVNNTGGLSKLPIKVDYLKMLLNSTKVNVLIPPTDHYGILTSRLKRIKKSTVISKGYQKVCELASKDTSTLLAPSVVLHSNSGESVDKQELVLEEMQNRADNIISSNSPLVSIISDKDNILKFKDYPGALYLRGPIRPEEIVKFAELGVDIFDTFHATNVATMGIALNISSDDGFTEEIRLDEEKYFDSFDPLSPTCGCIACSGADKTTCSYIHHLVKTCEMLAGVYLASHNLWQYANLCKSLRRRLAPTQT
jgi:hypothetical protein